MISSRDAKQRQTLPKLWRDIARTFLRSMRLKTSLNFLLIGCAFLTITLLGMIVTSLVIFGWSLI